MNQKNKTYIAIDLKSFYASVECMERGLNPLTTNLVVADRSRTEKTICLAVSPSMKTYGIPGRPRLFEVAQKVKEVNSFRRMKAPKRQFSGASYDATELEKSPHLSIDYIAAPPRMAHYIEYSTRIYQIYLKYIAPEDMHVYSIDEVFMDVTNYLDTYRMTAKELARKIINEVLTETGITATAGIGTNLYLCKIAMDIVAKHIEPDENGVRIAVLDEVSYRKLLWNHKPLQDFWRVGRGYVKKLESVGLFTMGDIARCSLGKSNEFHNEDLLYKLFGINAELLIDHAWGYEPCTMKDVKSYKSENHSVGSGQVLQDPYPSKQARLVMWEMADMLSLDLVEKGLVTNQIVLTVGYDKDNLLDDSIRAQYRGEAKMDPYGRMIPKPAHGTINMDTHNSSTTMIIDAAMKLFDRIVDPNLLVRRLNIVANHVIPENEVKKEEIFHQMDLFSDYNFLNNKKEQEKDKEAENQKLEKEKKLQEAMLDIKKKFGKNAILKGTNLEKGATSMSRNNQIGGHKA